MAWQFYAVWVPVGVVFVIVGGYRLWRERELRARGVSVHAAVVDHEVSYGGAPDPGRPTGRPWYFSTGIPGLRQSPIVEFTTADGTTVRCRSRASTSTTNFVPGRVVTVCYDPADPRDVAIAGHGRGVMRLFVVLGIVMLALALVFATAPSGETGPLVAVGVWMLVGMVVLGIGVCGVGRVRVTQRRGTMVHGTVVGELTSRTRQGLTLYHPVVGFSLPSGYYIETAAERGRVLGRPERGATLAVRYHPEDPHRMVLVGDRPRPLFRLFMVLGAITLLAGCAILVAVLP